MNKYLGFGILSILLSVLFVFPAPIRAANASLVAGWDFERISNDSTCACERTISSYGNHNFRIYGPKSVAGKSGKGIEFDGSPNRGAFDKSILSGRTQGTIMYWFKSTKKDSQSQLNWGGDIVNMQYDGRYYFGFKIFENTSTGLRSMTAPSLNSWHHVAVAWNEKQAQIFIDGKLDNSRLARSGEKIELGTSAEEPIFGTRYSWDTRGSFGVLDELKIFSKPLSANEIAVEMGGLPPVDPSIAPFNKKLEEVRTALQSNPNYLQYAEYTMLKNKLSSLGFSPSTDSYSYNSDYYLKPRGKSPLSEELNGGIGVTNIGINGLDSNLDLITGGRAINESLQIGSIGSNVDGDMRFNPQRNTIVSALNQYYFDNKKYPETLQELVPTYIVSIPAGFDYSKSGNFYKLEISQHSQIKNVSEIKRLELDPHDWDSMIAEIPDVPKIFSLAPADDFLVYFRDLNKFSELENTIGSIAKPLQNIYGLSSSIQIKDSILKRLGIKNMNQPGEFIDEALFISHDFDFYPNTDYALVIKLKPSGEANFIANYLSGSAENRAKVGDYYVIASHKNLVEEIIATSSNSSASMANEKDAIYALSVLENDFDGFAYLSEDFVTKLTGPEYRLNARRRNTILKAIETLQYTVFAYRDITKSWPKTFDQISAENYIDISKIANVGDYSISEDGIVSHKDWGSIYNVTPVNRVPITTVYPAEINIYESFKEGYQSFWREFIDPVGIAIIVGDQIRFHTIILPLIDESQYNWLKDIAGGPGKDFNFLGKPDRIPSAGVVSKIDVDSAIYGYYKKRGNYADPEYSKCVSDFYRIRDLSRRLDDVCKAKIKDKAEAVKEVKEKLAETIGWKETSPVLDFIGQEITIAGGSSIAFELKDLTKFDVYIGVELKDVELTKKFIERLFEYIGERFGGSRGYGFFALNPGTPIKNTYGGSDFYIVPLGFTNIYYTFLNNRLYISVSQLAINNLIDGDKSNEGWSKDMARLFDYMGKENNLAAFINATEAKEWLRGMVSNQWASYSGNMGFNRIANYYREALILAETLPNYNGTLDNSAGYYRVAPRNWFDAEFSVSNGIIFIKVGDKSYEVNQIDSGTRNAYYLNPTSEAPTPKVKLSEIIKEFNGESVLASWDQFKTLGVGFSFTEEGLDIKLAFNNVANGNFDSRIGKGESEVDWNEYLPFIIVGLLMITLGTIAFISRLNTNKSPNLG